MGGQCVECECGYGSLSSICDLRTGGCQCNGESQGRQCDRCLTQNNNKNTRLLLDKKSLKCVTIKDRCPSNIEFGIQWPTTLKGFTSRQVFFLIFKKLFYFN